MLLLMIASFLLAALPLSGLRYFDGFYSRSGVCLAFHLTSQRSAGWQYSVAVFIVFNLISFSVIAGAYIWMFIMVIRSRSRVRGHQVRLRANTLWHEMLLSSNKTD